MSNKTTTTKGGISTSMVLFLVFLGLKLTKVIAWSWWWITAPLWGGIALVLGIMIIMVFIWCLIKIFE